MTFTSDQLVALVGFILVCMNIANMYAIMKGRAQEPNKERDDKITTLEKNYAELEGKYNTLVCEVNREKDKLGNVKDTMLDSTAVLMKAVQALITHELDGNNTKGLEKSQQELSKFVWDRLGHKEDDN